MSPEKNEVTELSPQQLEAADFFLETCGLQGVAGETIEMLGEPGSVRFGLGRCAKHLMDSTPDEIREMVMAKLDAQKRAP